MFRKIARKIHSKLPIKIKSIIRYFLSDKYGKKYYWAGGNYIWIYPFLDKFLQSNKKLKHYSIVEIGSRDCLDAIEFAEKYNPQNIFVFEASRSGIQRCCEILKDNHYYSKNIIFHGIALGEKDEFAEFYEFSYEDPWALNKVNIGASSMGAWTSENLPENHRHKNINNASIKYKVPVLKGDNFLANNTNEILLICIDVEGFELSVMKGLHKTLSNTIFVCVELSYNLNRKNVPADADIVHEFLLKNNFKPVFCDATKGNFFPKKTDFTQVFNCLYQRKN